MANNSTTAIVNATPHDVAIYTSQDSTSKVIVSIAPAAPREGIRLKSNPQEELQALAAPEGQIRVFNPQVFTDVIIPAALQAAWDSPHVAFIVSLPVAQFAAGRRQNVFTVASGPTHVVRSASGQIIGSIGLERHS